MSQKKTYAEYVRLGRKMLATVQVHQVYIAFFATEVCQISHGGAVGRKLYTLKDYARDIGMNNKTLSEWVNTYRVVIQKLGMDINEVTIKDWTAASRVLELLKAEKRVINAEAGTPKVKDNGWKLNAPKKLIKDLFNQNYDRANLQFDIHRWTDSVIFIKNKLIARDLSECSTSSLLSLKENLDKASDTILDHLMNKRNVDLIGSTQQ